MPAAKGAHWILFSGCIKKKCVLREIVELDTDDFGKHELLTRDYPS
jgi:hypothetical protein